MEIQSNAIREDYMHTIMDKTIKEIHNDIVTVFGPYATDAFITKNGQPYYTRDGKELLESMKFDNEISMYLLKIIYQSVAHQGNNIGDGTTTLAVFYTNLYNAIRNCEDLMNTSISVVRPLWKNVINRINRTINKSSHKMTDDDFKSVLYTCTQDAELSSKIYQKIGDKIIDQAYIIPVKSNISTDFNVTVHNDPLVKATKQYSIKPFKTDASFGTEKNCVLFHCNGILDIAHPEIILNMIQRVLSYERTDTTGKCLSRSNVLTNIVILCNGLSEATRHTLKTITNILHEQHINLDGINNFTVFTLDEYRKYSSDETEDLSTIITDENGIGSMVNPILFEAILFQSFYLETADKNFETLANINIDSHIIDKMRDSFYNRCELTYDESEGLRIHKNLGPVAQKRYNELRVQIEEERSPTKQVSLNKRLRTIYGQFVEVEVGSKLIKDSQRKYELILDATRSCLEAVKYGVLHSNSILTALITVMKLRETLPNDGTEHDIYTNIIYEILAKSLYNTFCDMLANSGIDLSELFNDYSDFYYSYLSTSDVKKFDLTRSLSFYDILPSKQTSNKYNMDKIKVTKTDDFDAITITKRIVEPVTVITNIMENSTTPLELAMAKTFHTSTFIQNYI